MEGLIRGLALTFDDKTFFSAYFDDWRFNFGVFFGKQSSKKTIFLYFILIPCTSQDSLLFFFHHYPLKTIFLCETILVKLCLLINKQWQRSIHFSYMVGSGYEISKGLHHYLVAKLRVRHAKTNISLICFSHFVHLPLKRRDPQIPPNVSYFSTKIFFLLFFIFIYLSNAEMTWLFWLWDS